jgi:hypothetical protein
MDSLLGVALCDSQRQPRPLGNVTCDDDEFFGVGVAPPPLHGSPHGEGSGVIRAGMDGHLGGCTVRCVQATTFMVEGMGMHNIM